MKRYLFLLILFSVTLLLFHQTLFVYFSQDDFFHFKVSQTDGSLGGFLNLFGFHSFEERSIAFYRPVSRELLFNLSYYFFDLNQLPLRVFSLIVHLLNILLVYFFVHKIFKQKFLSFFVSFFYAISATNIATLNYLAGGLQTLLSTTFTIISLISFMKFLETKKRIAKIASFSAFLLAIGSFESSSLIPFLLIGLIIILKQRNKIQEIINLWPYFFIDIIYLLLDFFIIGFSSQEKQYQLSFGVKSIVNSFAWYSSWALGLPEMLIDFVNPGLKINPVLIRYWGNYYSIIFPAFFLTILILIVSVLYLFVKHREILKKKVFYFMIIWFPLGILPMVFLPLHKSSHYLTPVLVPFWTALLYLVFSIYKILNKKNIFLSKVYLYLFILCTVGLSLTAIKLQNETYWAVQRGKIAHKLIEEVKTTYPSLPKEAVIYFKNDPAYPFLTEEWGGTSKQASLVLNGSDALQLLYKDPTLKVFYEDLGGIPREFKENSIYRIMAKIL